MLFLKKKILKIFHFYKEEMPLARSSTFTKRQMKKEYGYVYSGHFPRKKVGKLLCKKKKSKLFS